METGEHGLDRRGVANCTECADRRFPTNRVGMSGHHPAKGFHGAATVLRFLRCGNLAESPCCGLRDEGLDVREPQYQRSDNALEVCPGCDMTTGEFAARRLTHRSGSRSAFRSTSVDRCPEMTRAPIAATRTVGFSWLESSSAVAAFFVCPARRARRRSTKAEAVSPDSAGSVAGWESPRADTMSTSEETLPPPSAEPFGPVATGRRKRWPYVTGVILAVVLVLVIASFKINLNYFAVVPGQAQAVGPLLSVPSRLAHPIKGQLLLTDVGVGDVTLGNWLYYKLDSNAQLYTKSDFIPTGATEQEYNDQGVVEMDESQLTAAAVVCDSSDTAFRTTMRVCSSGRPSRTDAYTVLHVGDVITSLDSIPTPNAEALAKADGSNPGPDR